MTKFFVVSSSVLPEAVEAVIKARNLLNDGKAKDISEAVKQCGISRGTYYKYRDQVYALPEKDGMRKAAMNLIVRDEKGVLSVILAKIAQMNCSVLAINQTIPIRKISNVSLTLDITDLACEIEDLLSLLQGLDCVEKAELVAIE